jgi:hypothetical protein
MGKVEPIHHSIPAQQVGQLSNVRHDPSCLILREQLGRLIVPPALRVFQFSARLI